MGFETDGYVAQLTSPRLFSITIIAKAVYIYCSPSLEIIVLEEGGLGWYTEEMVKILSRVEGTVMFKNVNSK